MKKYITSKICACIILVFTLADSQAQAQKESEATLSQQFQKFENLEDLKAKEEFYQETRKVFPRDTVDFTSRFTHDLFLAQLAKESFLADKLKKYRKYQKEMTDPEVLSMILGKLLLDWAEDIQNQKKIRDTGQHYLRELEGGNRGMGSSVRSPFLEKFGSALLKVGEEKEALTYFELALEDPKPKESAFLADYAIALAKNGAYTEAKNVLSIGLQSKKNKREPLLVSLEKVFVLEGSDLESYHTFLEVLDFSIYEQVYKEVLAKREEHLGMAPDFELRNLKGEYVSLDELKGKVIVLDFWATWCLPCKSSFPGMQLAVEAYEDDPKVQFLFVNAFERPKDAQQRVESYIKEEGFPFEILMDSENLVAESYGVEVLPSKIVIGPEGSVQFISTGAEGNDMAVFNHMKAMIEIASK